MRKWNRLLLAFAGLAGAGGVAAAAGSAHGGDQRLLGAAALVALTHAALLVAMALSAPNSRLFDLSTVLLIVGIVLFCGDLALKAMTGNSLFPMAAPTGGIALIAGWLTLSVAAIVKP